MKDTNLVERYSKYLNKCLFITNDQFIKKKYMQHQSATNVDKQETFYERMEKDKIRRDAAAKASLDKSMRTNEEGDSLSP